MLNYWNPHITIFLGGVGGGGGKGDLGGGG